MTVLLENGIEVDHHDLPSNLAEHITVEDYDALIALPVGTEILDRTNDRLVVREDGYYEWYLNDRLLSSNLTYDRGHEDEILPAVVLNPEILGEFSAGELDGFEVGDRVEITGARTGEFNGITGTVVSLHPNGWSLGDLGEPKLLIRTDVKVGCWNQETYWPTDRVSLLTEDIQVGSRVEISYSRVLDPATCLPIPVGTAGVVIGQDDDFLRVQLDNGIVVDGYWPERYRLSTKPLPVQPRLVPADSLPVVLDVEALDSLPNGTVVTTLLGTGSESSASVKRGGSFANLATGVVHADGYYFRDKVAIFGRPVFVHYLPA